MGAPQDGSGSIAGLGPWRSGTVNGFVPFPDAALRSSITERFLDIAGRHAAAPALSSPAGSWTYAELAVDVRRHAAAIVDRVGSSGESLAILADHDGPLVVAILAVIASGNVVVVVDPMAPLDQQRHVVRESGAVLILHDESHAEGAAALVDSPDDHTVPAVVFADLAIADPEGFVPPERGPDSPVMLAFTSGTSGASKAAVITQAVLLNVARGATNALGITAADRMPMLFPPSLAVAAYPLFLPLLNGGTLATLDVRSVGLEPIGDFLAGERITLAYMAPTVIRFLVDALAGKEFPDMRMIALGGELVDAEVMDLTAAMFTPVHVAVGYGTTESGVISLHVQSPDDPVDGTVPCGHPVPDVEIVILDEVGGVVEQGSSGEIAIASPFMFDGYRGHPELNRQVLSDDPAGRDGWRLYRTGDFGRVGPDGEVTVLGRIDTKVKVHGRMVVLGDVEADLHGLDAVADAVVVASSVGGVTQLVAFVVGATGHDVDGPSIRTALLETRESYRVPSRFVIVDELPRLPNGKVDRRALPDPDSVSPSTGATDAPTTSDLDPLRREIRDLWETLLPVGIVGLDDDFMALGGDSLLAAQMLVMLEQRVGVTVPMGELIHARSVRELAAVVARLRGSTDSSTVAMVQEGTPDRPRLWFVHDLQGSAYRVRHVAAELGADVPVWSFESPLLAGEANRYRTLDDFAARYVADLLESQPEGPYWLAGYSFGGICAYEMARQLVAAGHEVAFLGVVDVGPGYRGPGWHDSRSPFRPWFGVAKPPPEGSSFLDAARHYREMWQAGPKVFLRHLSVRSGAARVIDPRRFAADLRRRGRVRPEWRLWYAWEQHWHLAAKAWDRANPYSGRLDLYWADDTPSTDTTLGWGPLVAEIDIHRFAGDHEGILEERGASALAAALRPQLPL